MDTPEDTQITWSVRPFAPGDEARVTQLFERVFERPLSVAHYRWKVVDSPWPIGAPTVWLADTGEQVVGQYACTPMRYKLGDAELLVVHSCDAMTDPAFRRQGVLSAVGTAATTAWREAGIPFVTGLPHAGWGSRLHHLGWREQFKALWLWRPLRLAPALLRRGAPAALAAVVSQASRLPYRALDLALGLQGQAVAVEEVVQPDEAFDHLWERVKSRYEALVVRDRAWLTYRYVEAPGVDYRFLVARRGGALAGYLVYRLTTHDDRRTGWIVDLLTDPADAAARAALIRAALQRLEAAGAESVRVLLGAGTPLVAQFRRAGFLRARGDYGVYVVPLRDDQPHSALRDPLRWFVMAGDFDIL